MEHDGCHLDSFSSSITQYCNEVLIHKNCVSSTFRKHSIRNEEGDQFSFRLKTQLTPSRCRESISQQIESSCLTEEDFEKLKVASQSWALHLADVSIKGSKLCLKLDKQHTFDVVLKVILTQKFDYGKDLRVKQKVKLTVDEASSKTRNGLTEKRLELLTKIARKLLTLSGHQLTEDDADVRIHFGARSISGLRLQCGAVVNAATGSKEVTLTADDYYDLRLEDMKIMSAHKHWDTSREQVLHNLAHASVVLDLTQVKPSHVVTLNLEPGAAATRESSSKGAAFILYNCARLASIRQQCRRMCDQAHYPAPPSLEDAQFHLLDNPEEWSILLNYLLEYPALLRRVEQELLAGKANLHNICAFLSRLCLDFSMYYRRVRVLLEPKDHLFPLIFARVQFLSAIEQVLDNCLSVLGIAKIEQM